MKTSAKLFWLRCQSFQLRCATRLAPCSTRKPKISFWGFIFLSHCFFVFMGRLQVGEKLRWDLSWWGQEVSISDGFTSPKFLNNYERDSLLSNLDQPVTLVLQVDSERTCNNAFAEYVFVQISRNILFRLYKQAMTIGQIGSYCSFSFRPIGSLFYFPTV